MTDPSRAFIHHSRAFLTEEFLPRIRAVVEALPEEDLWWRPNEASNSIGNLVLHLAGNVRQWIVSGVGGLPDDRNRQGEFDRRDPLPARELLDRLTATVEEADAVLSALPEEELVAPRTIQGRETTVLGAVYHVVEHFSMHTGQIAYIAKLRLGRDLGFYRVEGGVPRSTWQRNPEPPA
jgi:uncharacterized damage-inducible protein DinB